MCAKPRCDLPREWEGSINDRAGLISCGLKGPTGAGLVVPPLVTLKNTRHKETESRERTKTLNPGSQQQQQ